MDLRAVGICEVPEIGRYDYRSARRGLTQHRHSRALEICYLSRGRQTYRVGGTDYRLSGGDVFVTFPNELHSTGQEPQEKGRLYWIQFILPKRRGRFLHCDALQAAELITRLRDLPKRHFSGEATLGEVLDDILQLAAGGAGPLQSLRIQNRLIELLLRILDLSQLAPSVRVSPSMHELMQYITDHVQEHLPLRELANRLHLSVPRFKSRFKAEVGVPPAEFVLRRKIEAAQRMLLDPGVSVTRVAMELGFSSSQYFATVVRRFTGKSPSALRGRAMITL